MARVDKKPRALSIQLVRQPNGSYEATKGICQVITPAVTAQMVIDRALRLIPTAAIGLAPKTSTLVNMQTIMWVHAPAKQTLPTALILGKQVRITIVLDHVSWTFGDDTTHTTTSAGTPYDATHDACHTKLCPDYYGHVYADTGTPTITATAAWRASFTVGNGSPTAIPGTINGPTATTTIRVREARSVLVANPSD